MAPIGLDLAEVLLRNHSLRHVFGIFCKNLLMLWVAVWALWF